MPGEVAGAGFARIVCDAPGVRAAFDAHPPTRRWWSVVLWLHGKPAPRAPLSDDERARVVADGFRFYAGLYRLLGALLAFAALAAAAAAVAAGASAALALSGVLAGAYLWFVTDLGFAGARLYGAGRREAGRIALIGFFVMIVAFLGAFTSAALLPARAILGLPLVPGLAAAAALLVFGVGSYLIEIVYLATDSGPNPPGD
ncbi:MAG TPA: hypothetical protein VM490_18160 [Armatimonadaceae bacterium]|nr:hypothetical protein [Armatimonadaceae bacterium]